MVCLLPDLLEKYCEKSYMSVLCHSRLYERYLQLVKFKAKCGIDDNNCFNFLTRQVVRHSEEAPDVA